MSFKCLLGLHHYWLAIFNMVLYESIYGVWREYEDLLAIVILLFSAQLAE